jgi:hypothetical protein
MIDNTVSVSSRLRIVDDVSTFVARFVDGCTFAGPEQVFLDGQIAKYGLLDMRFNAPSTMLDSECGGGVPLLRKLGFVDGDMQKLAEELGGDGGSCIEELRDGIAANRTHLMLFLESSNPNVSDMSMMDRMAPLLLWCGIQLKRIESPGLCYLGAALSVVLFLPLGWAICIWAIVALNRPVVREAFRVRTLTHW